MDEHVLNELLECSVCLDRLDISSKVLPCQHTFCRRCLEEILSTKQELRCPECRNLVETRVEDLPPNILLIRLLEGLKNSTAKVGGYGDTGGVRVLGSPSSPSHAIPSTSGGVRPSAVHKPGVSTSQPCAKALFNYESTEPGDLSFKKNDLIVLRKQVDENWYHGDLNGQHGFFPATYVQIITPLEVPQCKAVFDFVVNDRDEKDCLTFQKDEILTVIRRVDDNWAEGKLGERIGIFPVSFVEMNDSAKWLVNNQANQANHQVRITQGSYSQNTTSITTAITTISSTVSSTSTPTTSSPSLPPAQHPFLTALQRTTQKRHSLSTVSSRRATGSPPHQRSNQQRHSVELPTTSTLSLPTATTQSTTSTESSSSTQIASVSATGSRTQTTVDQTVTSSASTPTRVPVAAVIPRTSVSVTSTAQSARSGLPTSASIPVPRTPTRLTTGNNAARSSAQTGQATNGNGGTTNSSSLTMCPGQICVYGALYNYKPQKDDEIELKKGEYYTVMEKCQDGWFKGTCLTTGNVGVFPGNYMQPVKLTPARTSVSTRPAVSAPVATSCVAAESHPVVSKPHLVTVSRAHSFPKTMLPHATAEHGARSATQTVRPLPSTRPITNVAHTHARTSMANPQSQARTLTTTCLSEPRTVSQTQASKSASPRGAAASAVSAVEKNHRTHVPGSHSPRNSRKAERSVKQHIAHGQTAQAQRRASSSPASAQLHHSMSTIANVTPPNVVIGATGGSNAAIGATGGASPPHIAPSSAQKDKKEKKERDRLLLMMKRISTATKGKKSRSPPPGGSEQAAIGNGAAASAPTPHQRSGSLPGETPEGAAASPSSSGQHKKAISLDSASSSGQHKKAVSLDSAPQASAPKPSKPKPLVREKFRCIVPYPPQSDIELELKVGDIVYVHKKRDDGWYKGTLQRTGKTGLFPGSFVES